MRTIAVTELANRFLGYDLRLQRWRAIDVPIDELRAKYLLQEAEMLARLEHPAVERVIDVGEDGPFPFVVRDPLQGSASDHLPMTPSQALAVVCRIADGLSHAHSRGILHGTVRPGAIRFSEDGGAVLVGFGRQSEVDPSTSMRTAEPWAHVAPETRRTGVPDVASEVYALSATLYTLIAGRHQTDLFYAEAYDGMMTAIPAALRPVIYRGCAYNPSERPRDVESFRSLISARIDAFGSPENLPWRPAPLPERPPDTIVPDGQLQSLIAALGPRPSNAAAATPVAEESASTLHSGGRTPTYHMPHLLRKDPGFRDPYERVDPGDMPDYVDHGHMQGINLQQPYRFTVRPEGSGPQTPVPAQRISLTRAAAPLLGGLVGMMGGLLVLLLVALGGLVWVATTEVRADHAFVDAVRAEKSSIEALARASTDRQRIEDAWFQFDDDPTPEHAATFVRAAAGVEDVATAPIESQMVVRRLETALERWESLTSPR